MKPIIIEAVYDEETGEEITTFPDSTNGSGRLTDCYSCVVTEEINDTYTLTAKCQANSLHADLCVEGNYLFVSHDSTGDLQPFEIKKVKKKTGGAMEIYAEHVSYKTNRITVFPMSDQSSLANAVAAISTYSMTTNPFTFAVGAGLSSNNHYSTPKPMSVREVLSGAEGSIVDAYGRGEWLFDKFNITLMKQRGLRDSTNPARIRYRHNLTELTITTQNTSGYNAIVPFWYDPYTGERVMVAGGAGSYANMIVSDGEYTDALPVDLTYMFDSKPTSLQLFNAAERWLTSNRPQNVDPVINVKYSTAVDEDASDVVLGDYVTVTDKTVNYSGLHRVVKTVWNVLYERYDSVGVGKLPPTLYDYVRKVAKQ